MPIRDGLRAHPSVLQRYDHLAETGRIRSDPLQRGVAARLDGLVEALSERRLASKGSALGWLFGRGKSTASPVRGLYIHGGVGRGKTMLMDLFFDTVPLREKRRVHFNDFMAEAHDRIARRRIDVREGRAKGDDPIPPVAAEIAAGATLICFDEFTVTDIADAMILSRLFTHLFAHNVVLVATSNVAPRDLYRDGLNRPLFLPFVDTLERQADVVTLDGPVDYRLEKLGSLPVYVTPLGPEADRAMDEAWRALAGGDPVAPETLTLKGRSIVVPRAVGEAARFTFSDLCDEPLGARDYLAITDRFRTLVIDGIPILDQSRRNPTKRFILLIDTLYDRRVRLFASAEAPPDRLYAGRAGTTEAFEFDRTVSRLIEMQGDGWQRETSDPGSGET